jgi:hypothetical protein
MLTAPTQFFFQRREVSGIDLTVDFLQKMSTTSARGKVLLHLPIPSLFIHLLEPISQLFAFLFREVSNGILDGFHGHTLTIT